MIERRTYMKIKISVLFLTIVATLLFAVSCGDNSQQNSPPDDPIEGETEITVFSPERPASVVTAYGASGDLDEAWRSLTESVKEKNPSATFGYDTISAEDGTVEIAVGETSRAASAYAKDHIAANYDGNGFAFVICYKDGVLAIVSSDDTCIGLACDYFVKNYLTSDTLTVANDLFVYKTYTEMEYLAEYYAEAKAQELIDYANRWAEVDAKMPEDVAKALKSYYSIYDKSIIGWFANLYDPQTGAFYYSNSARDYEGFLPDLESTHQVLKDLVGAGCFRIYSDGLTEYPVLNALPSEVSDKIVAFVQSTQNPDDGYFYHVQWGKSISTERRDRDLSWAIAIMNRFGAEFLYPTALDRLQGAADPSAAIAGMMSEVSPAASLPSYLQSREAFYAWLDTKDFRKDSHGYGHTVGSMSNQIEAAGLLDDAIEYFNALQTEVYEEMKAAYDADPVNNPEPTGLWQKEVNYTSLSGLFKIGILYGDAGAPIQYADLAVKSAVKCLLSDVDPKTVIYAYNPWAGLSTALNSVKRANKAASKLGEPLPYDYDAIYAYVLENAAAMIQNTTYKLSLFQKEDGSFSYYQSYAAPITQGTPVSLGINEGDVNATTVAMDGATSIFGALGLSKPQLWTATDLDGFISIVTNAAPIEKQEMVTDVMRDFEDCEDGAMPDLTSIDGGNITAVTTDPTNPDNKVFRFDYPGSQSTGYTFSVVTNYREADAYLFEAMYMMESAKSATTHQVKFISSNGKTNYMLTFAVSGGYLVIDDCATISNTNKTSGMGIMIPVGEWFKLGVELYNDGTAENFRAKIYINGVCRFISNNFYGSQDDGALPPRGMKTIQYYSMKSPSSSLLIDDVHTDVLKKSFDPSDLQSGSGEAVKKDTVTYDYETPNSGFTAMLNYPGSTQSAVSDPTASGKGNVLAVTKSSSESGYTDDYRFDSPDEKGNKMTFSMDIYFDELAFADTSYTVLYQVSVGAHGGTCPYMFTFVFDASDNTVYLGDASSTGSGKSNAYKDVKMSLGRWYNVKAVVNLESDPSLFSAELYIDGALVATSKNYYGSEKNSTASTSNSLVNIRVQRRVLYKAYIDNAVISFAED